MNEIKISKIGFVTFIVVLIIFIISGAIISSTGYARFNKQAKEYRSEITASRETINELENNIDSARKTITKLNEQIREIRKDAQIATESANQLAIQLTDSRRELLNIRHRITESRESGDKATEFIGSAREDVQRLIEKLQSETD